MKKSKRNFPFENKTLNAPFLSLGIICLISAACLQGSLEAAKISKIAAGGAHSLILKEDGSLWTVGSNTDGQLGDNGITTSRTEPFEIETSGVTEIAAGENHSLFIKSDGQTKQLWGMGANSQGQLGDSTGNNQVSAVLIDSGDIFSVSADGNHSLYLKSDGTTVELRGMGSSENGQLGTTNLAELSHIQIVADVGADANRTKIKISSGSQHSLYLEDNGTLRGLGKNDLGQLGNGKNNTVQSSPVIIETSGVTDISAGGDHSLYIKDGKLWAMGSNVNGQLGDSTYWDRNRPIIVPGIIGTISYISAGKTFSFFGKQDGTVWGMGDNREGQLGNGTNSSTASPFELSEYSNSTISSGGAHVLFLKSNGSVWASGKNASGQLGNGTFSNSSSAVAMKAYYLTLSVSGTGGSVPSSANYAYDENVTLTATPSSGFVFSGWTGGKSSTVNPYTFSIQQDLSISGNFSQDTADDDGDGLTNYEELINLGTNPSNNDTDGDGFLDADEQKTTGLDPKTANTGLRTFFIESENASYANGLKDGNASGIAYAQANPSAYNLFSQAELDAKFSEGNASGITYAQANPSAYNLFSQAELDAKFSEGNASGIAYAQANPSAYNLFNQAELDAKFSEGNASGIAYVQANPTQFNFLTDTEKSISYNSGFSDGNASGISWVQSNPTAYNLVTDEELASAVAEAKAEALAEVQADLATQGLSSLTFLEQVTGQAIPHTEGWFYQPGQGWLWTDREDIFPFIFRQGDSEKPAGWLWFSQHPDQRQKPLYDYNLNAWISISGN